MGCNQRLRITLENTYGTFDSGGTGIWIRLKQDEAFSMEVSPDFGVIRSADTYNRRVQSWVGGSSVAGGLQCSLYHAQAAALLAWATTLTVSGDGTPTLPSYTCDFFDGIEYHRYLGVQVQSLTVAAAPGNNAGEVTCAFSLIGQREGSAIDVDDLPVPAFTSFPSANPYTFFESTFKVGSTITHYNTLALTISNMLAPIRNATTYIDGLYWGGRDVNLATNLQHISSAQRDAWLARTAADVEWTLTKGGNSVKFDVHTTNYRDTCRTAKPLASVNRQDLSFSAFFTGGATLTDLTVTLV